MSSLPCGGAQPAQVGENDLDIEAIHVDGASAADPRPLQVAGVQAQALIALKQYGALTRAVDQDDRLRAGGIFRCQDLRLDTGSIERFGGLLAAHRANGGIVVAATHVPLPLPDAAGLRLS